MSGVSSSAIDSLWQRGSKNIAPGIETLIDSFNVALLVGRRYMMTASSLDKTKVKSFEMAITKKNGVLTESVFNLLGQEVIIELRVADDGKVYIKNNNLFEIRVDFARLSVG